MQRRHLITSALALPFLGLSGLYAYAEVSSLSDAINKAGAQRMLSQRMGKAWLALVHGIEKTSAQQVLEKSMALFERQLHELKAFAPSADIKATYTQMETSWRDYKVQLVGMAPQKNGAAALLQQDAKVLALAHQGTQQFEATLGKPQGKLINLAGRQRMLSQRLAKFYLAAKLPVDAAVAAQEIDKARTEFMGAMSVLRSAPEATARIKEELLLADGQWVFFDMALQRLQNGQGSGKQLSEVFVASENLLSVMDNVTNLYAGVKT
jgi:hypothetical protein